VESSCEFGIEPSSSIKCWESIECPNTRDLSCSAQLHLVSYKRMSGHGSYDNVCASKLSGPCTYLTFQWMSSLRSNQAAVCAFRKLLQDTKHKL
jgi:hypothetical protein